MPLIISGGPECSHPITSMEPLEGTPFIECASCNAIFEDVTERPDGEPRFTGTMICDPVDRKKFFEREFKDSLALYKIKEVKRRDGDDDGDGGYSISTEESTGFFLTDERNKQGIEPMVGDDLSLWTINFSYITGVYLNRIKVFHLTADERNQEDYESAIARNRQKAREFHEKRDEVDADYEALPEVFQRRIDKYRENNPTFRTQYEGYEMSCLIDAVKVAERQRPRLDEMLDHAPDAIIAWANEKVPDDEVAPLIEKTTQEFAVSDDPDAYLRNIAAWKVVQEFNDLPYDEQKDTISDGHSGNSHGMVLRMAWLYLAGRDDDIVRHYGALAALVGSDDYGDVPRDEVAV